MTPSFVCEADYQAARGYVRDSADKLYLRDWTVDFFHEHPETISNTADAAIRVDRNYLTFDLWLPPKWYEKCRGSQNDREAARQTLAHELLHVHLQRLDVINSSLESNLGDHVWGVWHCMYTDEMERVVDHIAYPLAEVLDMPPPMDGKPFYGWKKSGKPRRKP